MTRPSVLVVGSGAGGSVVAWALALAGHPVVVLDKGRNLLPGLGTDAGVGTLFANDEVKADRFFENQDPVLEPRSARTQAEARHGTARSFVGDVNTLPTVVGGGTVHWDGKTPRFWRQDFTGRSLYGPVEGANVADWPLTYDELAPFYDEVEARLGVQGDLGRMPAATLAQAPRSRPFPLPPNQPMLAGARLADGAARLGYHAYPFPMAVSSRPFDGRPPCNSCGFCSGFGCPINARGGAAVSFLHQAMRAGAELRPRCFVTRVDLARDGRRALGVSYRAASGVAHHERADVVVLAASAVESPRLALLSATTDHAAGVGNRSGQVGRNVMFHFFTNAVAVFEDEVHSWRGPSTTTTMDDFVGPHRGHAARSAGLPYLKGGICEVGGTLLLLQEAQTYASGPAGWGVPLKQLMRLGVVRSHLAAMSLVGEDLPQVANRVDLDPTLRDVHGLPVPRITHSPHRFELAASGYYGPRMAAVCAAAPKVVASAYIPAANRSATDGGAAFSGPAATAHVMGTMRMGHDPSTSVVDAYGRMHDVDNLYVADGSVFVSSGGFNPTLTIMALALRTARHIAGAVQAG